MNYLPWIAVGAVAGYAYRRRGRRTEAYAFDQVTGEPIPPYPGRGRPRSYNSDATKRTAVMQGEFYKTALSLPSQGHLWTADRLTDFLFDLSQMRNDFNVTPVCDGALRFRDEPVIFDQKKGKKFKTGPGRGREIYECYARPGRDETGKIMTMSRYYNVKGKRRRGKKAS